MSPRSYDNRSRLAAAEETRRRVLRAAVELHAEHGALGTTHEMIAERAGVSLPTVYKYFPTRNDIIPDCTGLVLSEAPVKLDATVLEGKDDVASRLRAVARRTFELYEYLAPWLRWTPRDAAELPALAELVANMAGQREQLVRAALAPAFARPPRTLVLVGAVLLDFPSWAALTGGGLSTARAAAVVADALVHLTRTQATQKEGS